jgi:putative tryptophan/tyrosine transport system substrate-binding protein
MKRREFIILLGSSVAWPLVASAQQAAISRLGVPLYSKGDPNIEAVLHGVRDLGYVEGRNIAIEFRYAEGKPERLPELAVEIVRLRPDVILALGTDVAEHVVKATQTIPLIFIGSADPVQLGLVASLARPGGNATGVTLLQNELASKRMELLKEAAPQVSQVAFIWNPEHTPITKFSKRSARRAHSASSCM